MTKLTQPAIYRKQIRKGLLTEEESKRLTAEANKRQSLEEESRERIDAEEEEEDNKYYWGD